MSGDHAKISWNQGGAGGGLFLLSDEGKITTGVMPGEAAEVSYNEGPLGFGSNSAFGGVGMSFYSSNDLSVKAPFTMSGRNAKIRNNSGGSYCGGVFVDTNCVFTMEGGEIFGNKSTNYGSTAGVAGGGVKVVVNPGYNPALYGTFIMTGGTVYGYLGGADPLRNAVDGGDQTQGQYTAALAGAVSLPKGGMLDGVAIVGGTQLSTSGTISVP
jgi:hypothetical protein